MSASVQINDTGSTVAVTIQDAQVLVGVPTVVAHNDLIGRSAADAHPASAVTNTPAGGVSATTVQTAINELDTKKAPLASPALSGIPTAPTAAPDTNTTQIATCAFAKAEADAAQAASQPLDAELTALASTTSAADKVPYFTGTGTATTAGFTAAGRALVDDANAAAQLATLGIPLLATSGITGVLTLAKTGTTARTATLPDASIVVAGSASALTSGRVPYATTGGLLTDDASLTYSTALLIVGDGSTNTTAGIRLRRVSNNDAYIEFRTGALVRWYQCCANAESTGNAGSNWFLRAYDDAQSLIDTPISITRAAGGTITLARPVSITNTTASTTTATGALVVAGGVGIGKEIVMPAADWIYFGPVGTDGTWRFGRIGNDFVHQRRESGSYVEKGRVSA